MYIYIFDDLSIKAYKEIGEGDLKAADDGYLSIINIKDNQRPTEYFNGEWTELEVR